MPSRRSGIIATSVAALHAALTPVSAQESTKNENVLMLCKQNSGMLHTLNSQLAELVTEIEKALPEGHPQKGAVETFITYPVSWEYRTALITGMHKQVDTPEIRGLIRDITENHQLEERQMVECIHASGGLPEGVTYVNPEVMVAKNAPRKDTDGLFTAQTVQPGHTGGYQTEVTLANGRKVVAWSAQHLESGR